MASETRHSDYASDFSASAEQDLLRSILQDEIPYCWNVAQKESEAYFGEIERAFGLNDWPEAVIQGRS